ncbi:hypothetical protein DPMN_052915 [Dreissena polymorpha]|uniref:Uncharacterized protein n=1 Tax=Dreissena polymorpha TaxID=45954 RepID=A0A9D4CLN3_DREPO|nr:hypothetical protein DPMN_052915 [Dreissena polymorpha]
MTDIPPSIPDNLYALYSGSLTKHPVLLGCSQTHPILSLMHRKSLLSAVELVAKTPPFENWLDVTTNGDWISQTVYMGPPSP